MFSKKRARINFEPFLSPGPYLNTSYKDEKTAPGGGVPEGGRLYPVPAERYGGHIRLSVGYLQGWNGRADPLPVRSARAVLTVKCLAPDFHPKISKKLYTKVRNRSGIGKPWRMGPPYPCRTVLDQMSSHSLFVGTSGTWSLERLDGSKPKLAAKPRSCDTRAAEITRSSRLAWTNSPRS